VDITVFLGAPGSGKGTQAKLLAQNENFRHFSTGDMLRASIQSGSDVGLKAKRYIDGGELVPDTVMIELIESALNGLPDDARVILDGFPRTHRQAVALDASPKTSVNRAIYFMVPEKMLVARLTGRRICEKCGQPFHALFLPPKQEGKCDRCGGKLIQRPDDTESVVRRRLEVFAEQNNQLLDYFGRTKKLREINADVPVESLGRQLLEILN
jgi:adenylate kinase